MKKGSTINFPTHIFIRIAIIFYLYINIFASAQSLTACELEQVLSEIVHPEQGYELHAAALRNQLRNLMEKQLTEDYQNVDGDGDALFDNYDKRSIATLAREGHLKGSGKRNLGALARSGLLRGTQLDSVKRSLATLAKNGHLPSSAPSSKDPEEETDETQSSEKRSLSSLARNNYLINGKRSIVEMVRNRIHPQHVDNSLKRNLAALARSNLLVPTTGKRNVGNLARDWILPNHHKSQTDKRDTSKVSVGLAHEEEKRNVGALKSSPVHGLGSTSNSNKQKREVSYTIMDEIPTLEQMDPNYQSSPFDYEELTQTMDAAYPFAYTYKNNDEKRYLGKQLPLTVMKSSFMRSGYRSGLRSYGANKRYVGALARLGSLRGSNFADSGFRQRPEKRHVGAAFRSGWLPYHQASFRPVRGGRFSRSGRARPDFTPHTTYAGGPSSTEFVDAVIPALQTSLAGTQRDYLAQQQTGATHTNHHAFLPSIGENFDRNPYYHHQYAASDLQQQQPQEQIDNNNNNDENDNNNYKQDIMFNLDAIDPTDMLENNRQMQCYQRLKAIYVQIMTENDMPYNDLMESNLF